MNRAIRRKVTVGQQRRRRQPRGIDALLEAVMAPAMRAARARAKALLGPDDAKVPPSVSAISEARDE